MSNVVSFPANKVEKTLEPVSKVCELAAENFKDLIILGPTNRLAIPSFSPLSPPHIFPAHYAGNPCNPYRSRKRIGFPLTSLQNQLLTREAAL